MITITKIEPINILPQRKKVCAYARVSNGKDMMLHSLANQVSYYSKYIQSNPKWSYVGVYADEAMTGTKDSRENFQRMLDDCKNGKIDMIITKSISRFARNTLTLLKVVRELKDLGIDVYFEEQNIHSLSSDGEMILTLLASFAQEESRSVSENMKWRIRKDFEQGIIWGGKDNYGYKIIDKKFIIDPEPAKLVKRIFDMVLEGYGVQSIANELNKENIKSPYGKKWGKTSIKNILRNTNYTGDLILQKTYVDNHLTKITKNNNGELNKYVVEDNHEVIISKEQFEEVQAIMASRAHHYKCRNNVGITYPFTGLIKCGICGKNYKHKVSNGKNYWICSTFVTIGKSACASKQIPEEILNNLALGVISNLDDIKDKVDFIEALNGNVLVFHFKDDTWKEFIWKDKSRKDSWTNEMKEKARQKALQAKKE